jgi:hypothetical protein
MPHPHRVQTVAWSHDTLVPYVSQALGIPAEKLFQAFGPAVRADLPAILALRHAVLGDGIWWDDDAFVRWRYFETEPVPYWVFKKHEQIIGACGLEPVVLVVNGEPHAAVRTLDIMVHPDVEGRGLGAFMNMALFKHFPITMVTGSNARSHRLISRMFQHVLDLRAWKVLIESRDIIEQRLKLGALSWAAAPPVNLLLAFQRWMLRTPPPKHLQIRELTHFDEQVTQLSRSCEAPGRILVRRSAEYLTWRFVRNPRCRYGMLGGFVRNRLVGYVVTRFNLSRPNPRKEAEIVDWLALPSVDDGVSPLPFLIRAGLEQLMRQGARLVSCMAFDESLQPTMTASGFRFRPDERLPFFVQAGRTPLHARLSSMQGWYLTRGDFDVE